MTEDLKTQKKRSQNPQSQCTVCIGRDKELKFIGEQFEKPSSATLIYGDPAIGKSEFLKDIEKIHHSPDKRVYVGRWECGGSEDALLYALANLLGKLHEGLLKDQSEVLWEKIKESFSSLEAFNDFAEGLLNALKVPGSGLPDFLRSKFKLKVDPSRIPLLNREIFLGIVDQCQEIDKLKLIFLLDNLSIGFENKPTPAHVQKAFETLRNVLERIREKSDIHLVVSWKLTSSTIEDFRNIKELFSEYFHEHLQLGPIEDKKGYIAWLNERCASFASLDQGDMEEVLEFTGFLPMIVHEWERQEHHREGKLGKEELEEIARDARERKYRYLDRYLDEAGREELKDLVYQLSVLHSTYGLTLHQIAELFPMPGTSKICQCGLEGSEQKSFIDWQDKCQRNLEQAMEMAIFKAEGKDFDNRLYFFDHETKKDYIRGCVAATPKRTTYLQRAFDFSINHFGFPTREHPYQVISISDVYLLLNELAEISHHHLRSYLDALDATKTFLSNYKDPALLLNAMNLPGFLQLPPQIRVMLLSTAIYFPDKFQVDQVHEKLLATLDETATFFQMISFSNSLINAIIGYGSYGQLTKIEPCLKWCERFYETYQTPEVAIAYARPLSRAVYAYGQLRQIDEMTQCLKKTEELYKIYRDPEMAYEYASSLNSVANTYGLSDQIDNMTQCLEMIEELYLAHPTENVARTYGYSLAFANTFYKLSGQSEKMEQRLERLVEIYQTKPCWELATALRILMSRRMPRERN